MIRELYSGAGNTFLLCDNRGFHADRGEVPALCTELQIDGVIFLEHSAVADARMRIFNRDGSEAEMCGNGLRCLIHFLKVIGIEKQVYSIETLAGEHKGWISSGGVSIQLPRPSNLQLHIHPNKLHFLNTGVPHAVLFLPAIESIDVELQGRALRHSPLFAPAGANVNFASLQEGMLKIRTYERGVEAETLACGTGAAATALIAHKLFSLPSPITVQVQSGDTLKIWFNGDWSELILEGPVQINSQNSIMAAI